MANSYDYEEEEVVPKKKSRYKNPDDMLRTVPGVDPNRYKRGIAGFATGISSFIVAFVMVICAWIFSFVLAGAGLGLTLSQRKIKKTKISTVALVLNIAGLAVFAALIVLDLTTDVFKDLFIKI